MTMSIGEELMKMTFNDMINEAIQRSPALKSYIKSMQLDFETAFGDKLYSKKFDYDVTVNDLKVLFNLVNRWLFKDRLDIDNISFVISTNVAVHNEKGIFRLGIDRNNKHVMGIVKYEKDNLFHIINVFIHEMIHYYDFMHGPLKEKSDIAYVDKINGRQCVDRYDVHGKFFTTECKRINMYGFDVKEKYSIKDKAGMKKILEKNRTTDSFFDKTTDKDDEQYIRVKQFYDCLENCNKDMVYRDAKHWYVQID